MLILLDTGVLVRLLERTDPHHVIVRDALRLARKRGHHCVLCPQNAAEFWTVSTRPTSSRGGLGLSIPDTDRRLRIIERLFRVLPDSPFGYAQWRTLVVSHAVIGVQAHDARLVASMMVHGITHVLTLNPSDFARYPSIIALTPAAFLAAPP